MHLGDLIRILEAYDPDRVLPIGFGYPHSYRGDYSDLAFEPMPNVAIGAMLAAARSALGATYEGYKGGDYRMQEDTQCWLSMEGCSDGEIIGPLLLLLLCGPCELAQVCFNDHYADWDQPRWWAEE